MKGGGPCIRGRPSEPSVNDEASFRVDNGILFLAVHRLRYRSTVKPRDKEKVHPRLPPMAPSWLASGKWVSIIDFRNVAGLRNRGGDSPCWKTDKKA